MELSDVDLNLLLLFQRLMQERRVSSVAEQMNMSQPGVSNALAKLRRRLGCQAEPARPPRCSGGV